MVAAVVVVLTGERLGVGLVAVALLLAGVGLAGSVFTVRVALPAAEPPKRAVVIWNPRSGGGKALSNNLADEAQARGIEPIELKPGDDLEQLVRDAVAAGADGLAAAGGDGTQALVASIAAEHDLPFACIPAGTRNHFALDLGVDRDDVVGALDAFVTGGEHRVDLAEINGRVFVNNASLGIYAEAVQREGYRDAKLRTMLDTMPGRPRLPADRRDERAGLAWPRRRRSTRSAAVILISNNIYRLGMSSDRAPGRASTGRARDRRAGRRPTMRAAAGSSGRRPSSRSPPPSLFRSESTGGTRPRAAAPVREQAGRAARPDRAAASRRVAHSRRCRSALTDFLRQLVAVAVGRARLTRYGPVSAPVKRWLGLTSGEDDSSPTRALSARSGSRADRARRRCSRSSSPTGRSGSTSAGRELMARRRGVPLDARSRSSSTPSATASCERSRPAAIGLVLLITSRRAALLAFILAEALTPLLVNLIKLIVGRERPPAALIEAHGSSYPSGHAAYAGATTVILVLLFTTPGRPRRAWWAGRRRR